MNRVLTTFAAVIGDTSLLVAGAFEIWIAASGGTPCAKSIAAQVFVIDCAATSIMYPHSRDVLIDAVAAQSGIAALLDRHP